METVSFMDPESSAPSVAIVGAGIAGLACAVRLREEMPEQQVLVIEKPVQQSNSQMAGQRFRHGIAGKRHAPVEETLSLLASRNSNVATPEMKRFTDTAVFELENWLKRPGFVRYEDDTSWFGPQLGSTRNEHGAGRGTDVLRYFKDEASRVGVQFLEAEVQKLQAEDGHVTGLVAWSGKDTVHLSADTYVLANGSIGGQMYVSTNRSIDLSSHELAFDAGYDLIDSTVHMLHPFGKANSAGDSKLGCFETDQLAQADVLLDPFSSHPKLDHETTQLLREHQAHYHMTEIAEKFRHYGSVVMLRFPDGQEKYARVSHHYAHVGIRTTDGVRVTGSDNLLAIGDASGIGYWTNHQERFPGFALAKCLADASFSLSALETRQDSSQGLQLRGLETEQQQAPLSRKDLRLIRSLNTKNLYEWIDSTNHGKEATAQAWVDALADVAATIPHTITNISIATADAHKQASASRQAEPLAINKASASTAKMRPVFA